MSCVSPIATLAAAASPAAEVPAWIWMLITVAASIACVTDLRATRIPNWLTLPLLAAGLAYWTVLDGWSGLGFSSAGMGVAGLVFIIGYAMFGGGAGDAKLMMAFGAWIGPEASKILMLTVTGAGFVQAISVTIYRGGLWDVPYLLMHSVTTSRNAVTRVHALSLSTTMSLMVSSTISRTVRMSIANTSSPRVKVRNWAAASTPSGLSAPA